MIYEKIFYSVRCDNCGLDWANDDNEFAAMESAASMECVADESDWKEIDAAWYCPDCWVYDDDGQLGIRTITINKGDKKTLKVAGSPVEFYIHEIHNGQLILRSTCGKYGAGVSPPEWNKPHGNIIG